MEIPDTVAAEEDLGRRVSSSRTAERAQRSRVPIALFLPPKVGDTDISVDRLSIVPLEEPAAIADKHDSARGRTFYGWAVVTAELAADNGRQVVATSIPDENPYHADIVLLQSVADDDEQRKLPAQQLADSSSWLGSPTLPNENQ